MTLATQPEPAAGLRASFTCTTPRAPLTVPPSTLLARVPRLPAAVGTEIDNAPPVTVIVAVLSPGRAAAGTVMPTGSKVARVVSSRGRLRVRTAQTIELC